MRLGVWRRLIAGLPEYERKLDRRVLGMLSAELQAWSANRKNPESSSARARMLVDFLEHSLNQASQELNALRRAHGDFLQQFNAAADDDEAEEKLLMYASALGADSVQLAGDRVALRKRWFGADALHDRMNAQVSAQERKVTVALKLLGRYVRSLLQSGYTRDHIKRWQELKIEDICRVWFAHEGYPRIRLAAFACLADCLQGLPVSMRSGTVSTSTTQFIYRCALDARQYEWLQLEAVSLLAWIAPEAFLDVAAVRLGKNRPPGSIFLRRGLLERIAEDIAAFPKAISCLPLSVDDPSPYVRQGLAEVLAKTPESVVAACLPPLLQDRQEQVRAQALLSLGSLLAKPHNLPLMQWLVDRFAVESNSFALRTGMHVCNQLFASDEPVVVDARLLEKLRRELQRLHRVAEDLRVRRWAAETLFRMACGKDRKTQHLAALLSEAFADCPVGRQKRLPPNFDDVDAATLGRAALMTIAGNYGLDFERRRGRWYVMRGHRFGFRLWRWLHEFRHPSPDKRQAFRHTVGRLFPGSVRVPSPILAELAETKVPGEPLHMASESGWRPYLPLPDELISSLDLPAKQLPLRIYTFEGVTEVVPPESLWQRIKVGMRFVFLFTDFARARNWNESAHQPAGHYISMVREQGFTVRFTPHGGMVPDPAVLRFFPSGLAIGMSSGELWRDFQNYFFSAYGNTLFDLSLFAGLAMMGFLLRHVVLNRRIRDARKDIPLVIGGWGTRGKSGTERLKAALFNGMGYSVVSKTTGCEAMFLHSYAHQPLREMFLFRPYDKATIWEQLNVACIASQLKADVMLWECMALNPTLVELLQKRWMRDDLATITNTFPDHEDIQGPAGINIPEVMTRFIPENRTLLTSEEQMRPILSEAAKKLGTNLHGVGWLESGLLTPDVLGRFPYEEHPDNIALVVRMAKELGISANFALKEMADNVVPDLGVLKVYPESRVEGRSLCFANGMSANERFGCLSNWKRLGFDRIDMQQKPTTLISTVVNNRADRIARSQVFASIVVNDVDADLHFLIGSNLDGLSGYISTEWEKRVSQLSLWPADGTPSAEVLRQQAKRLRIPTDNDVLRNRLKVMLDAAGITSGGSLLDLCHSPAKLEQALVGMKSSQAEEICRFATASSKAYEEYQALAGRVGRSAGSRNASLDAEFRQQLSAWFKSKLIVVHDFHASGNQIIHIIARHTPPGFDNQIMGLQNIKGTGLDFVYRWQAWNECHAACADLRNSDPTVFRRGLTKLASFRDYGMLTDAYVRETVEIARQSPHAQLPLVRAQFDQISMNMGHAGEEIDSMLESKHSLGWIEKMVMVLEGFIDAGDALSRRRMANRIYVDLVNQRISHTRASAELLRLTQKQKGGWLYDHIRGRIRRWHESVQNACHTVVSLFGGRKPGGRKPAA